MKIDVIEVLLLTQRLASIEFSHIEHCSTSFYCLCKSIQRQTKWFHLLQRFFMFVNTIHPAAGVRNTTEACLRASTTAVQALHLQASHF